MRCTGSKQTMGQKRICWGGFFFFSSLTDHELELTWKSEISTSTSRRGRSAEVPAKKVWRLVEAVGFGGIFG